MWAVEQRWLSSRSAQVSGAWNFGVLPRRGESKIAIVRRRSVMISFANHE